MQYLIPGNQNLEGEVRKELKVGKIKTNAFLLAGILAVLSWEIHCLIWWLVTNGLSFNGKTINHFGELGQGNFIEWIGLSIFLGGWYIHQIILYFILWIIMIWIVKTFLRRKKSSNLFGQSKP